MALSRILDHSVQGARDRQSIGKPRVFIDGASRTFGRVLGKERRIPERATHQAVVGHDLRPFGPGSQANENLVHHLVQIESAVRQCLI
eukprot:2169146-Pleurochrysis_carterae.AAC.1